MEKLYSCFFCKTKKPKVEFHKCNGRDTGIQSFCKKCSKTIVKNRYPVKREYNKRWRRSEAGIKWYLANKDKMNKRHAEYRKHLSPEAKKRQRSREILKDVVRSGRIKRQPCTICGEIKSQSHHEDYSKPFEVIWLCHKHHLEKHFPPTKEAELISNK